MIFSLDRSVVYGTYPRVEIAGARHEETPMPAFGTTMFDEGSAQPRIARLPLDWPDIVRRLSL